MKYLLMLCMGMALFAGSVGCCAHGGCGGGGGAGGTPGYYGSGGYPAGAFAGGTSLSAAVPAAASYAYSQPYPTTAGLPINSLPTY